MAPGQTRSLVTISPLQQMLNPVLSIFFSRTLRVLLVLLLSVSCLTCIAISILVSFPPKIVITLVVLNVTIFLHHWYAMTKHEILKDKPRFGSFVDFVVTTAECTTVLYFMTPWYLPSVGPYEESIAITLICVIWVQVACLCLLWIIRLGGIVTQVIDKPFNFYAMAKGSTHPAIYGMVSGVAMSHDRHWFVFALRRAFTAVIALGLLAFSFTNLVLEPVQETGMTPEKLYTTAVFNDSALYGSWSIVAYARGDTFGGESKLHDAIHVNGMWLDNENVTFHPCLNRTFERPKKKDKVLEYMDKANVEMVVFDCPFGSQVGQDVLITVDFTPLGIDATSPLSGRAVSIVVGLHTYDTDTLNMLHSTWPIPLFPNAHLLGGVIPTIREQFKSPGLASLGLFSSKKVSVICGVPFLSPDPSLQVPRDNNTATLRLYGQDDFSDWHLSVDYRENSVLGGISAVGGIWTVLNGSFATIFGTTLLFVLFGTKPLSNFGLIHKIPKFRPVLDDEPRYRNLLSESQSDQGMLDYVRDHFVDLGPLEDSNQAVNERPNSGITSHDLTSDKTYEQGSAG